MPTGIWETGSDNLNSPQGNDGHYYRVFCKKNEFQQAYRIASGSESSLTYFRYCNSGTWRNWYKPYISNSDLWARFNPIRINGENGDTFSKVLKNKYNNSVVFVSFAGGVSDNPFSFDSGYAIVFNSGLLVFGNYFTLIGITHNASKAIETRFIDLTK